MREGSPNRFATTLPLNALESEAKSLFRNILAISAYGSRFCLHRLIPTLGKSKETKILGRRSKKL